MLYNQGEYYSVRLKEESFTRARGACCRLAIRVAIIAGTTAGFGSSVLAQDQSLARTGLPPSPAVADILGHDPAELPSLSDAQLNVTRNRVNAQLQSLQTELSRSRAAVPEAVRPAGTPRRPEAEITADISLAQLAKDVFVAETICGPRDRSQDVERYDGSLGPMIDFVARYRGPTGQVQWNDIPDSAFPPHARPNQFVKNVRYCTGTLIRDNMFLTAGHCLTPQTGIEGWVTPVHQTNGKLIPYSPAELAPLMHVNFNYEIDPATGYPRVPDVYPVLQLVEYQGPIGHPGPIDYAILQLGPGSNGTPNQRYGNMQYDASNASLSAASLLTVIQHPDGNPKRVAAGTTVRVGSDLMQLFYGDVDTLGGSSGSGIIDQNGKLIGVHTQGGCKQEGGARILATLSWRSVRPHISFINLFVDPNFVARYHRLILLSISCFIVEPR